jgi:three-Cys-motif partner protein
MPTDSDPSKWECPPHTKAKHQMLNRYLGGWYPILSSWNGRIVFLDGFAGRGRYNDGSEGSPLIALRCLLDHNRWPQMRNREFVFIFIEADTENAQSLEQEIDAFKAARAPWPQKVKTMIVNEKFDVTAQSILDYLRQQKSNMAPTFAFVDPFGYSGLPMDVLADLLSYPRSEVFVNFMVGHVQRFIRRDGQEDAMRSLFGMDVHRIIEGYNGQADRVRYLRDVYGQQLQERAEFDYVQSFGMINQTGNIGYYLFHGTRNRLGAKLMKEAMWKIDPGGGNTFSDRLAGQDVLFTLDPDLRPLRDHLLRHYADWEGVSIDTLEWHTILSTPYRETHVRPVLRKLEKEGGIQVNRPPGKTQFTNGVTIDFP